MSERPRNAGHAQTAGYLRIFIDVLRIIVINEVMAEGLTENNPGKCREKNADTDGQAAAVGFRRSN